jgi:hypothetical protein
VRRRTKQQSQPPGGSTRRSGSATPSQDHPDRDRPAPRSRTSQVGDLVRPALALHVQVVIAAEPGLPPTPGRTLVPPERLPVRTCHQAHRRGNALRRVAARRGPLLSGWSWEPLQEGAVGNAEVQVLVPPPALRQRLPARAFPALQQAGGSTATGTSRVRHRSVRTSQHTTVAAEPPQAGVRPSAGAARGELELITCRGGVQQPGTDAARRTGEQRRPCSCVQALPTGSSPPQGRLDQATTDPAGTAPGRCAVGPGPGAVHRRLSGTAVRGDSGLGAVPAASGRQGQAGPAAIVATAAGPALVRASAAAAPSWRSQRPGPWRCCSPAGGRARACRPPARSRPPRWRPCGARSCR